MIPKLSPINPSTITLSHECSLLEDQDMVGPMLEADPATNLVFEVVFETLASKCKGHMAYHNVVPWIYVHDRWNDLLHPCLALFGVGYVHRIDDCVDTLGDL